MHSGRDFVLIGIPSFPAFSLSLLIMFHLISLLASSETSLVLFLFVLSDSEVSISYASIKASSTPFSKTPHAVRRGGQYTASMPTNSSHVALTLTCGSERGIMQRTVDTIRECRFGMIMICQSGKNFVRQAYGRTCGP